MNKYVFYCDLIAKLRLYFKTETYVLSALFGSLLSTIQTCLKLFYITRYSFQSVNKYLFILTSLQSYVSKFSTETCVSGAQKSRQPDTQRTSVYYWMG